MNLINPPLDWVDLTNVACEIFIGSVMCGILIKVAENPVTFKVDKPGIQADCLLCLVKVVANSQFWESSSVHYL